jgi:N-acetylmuramoyl-L-alanine amidase
VRKLKYVLIYALIIVLFTGCAATNKSNSNVKNEKKVATQVDLTESTTDDISNTNPSQKTTSTINPPTVTSKAETTSPSKTTTPSTTATTPTVTRSGGKVICIDPGHGTNFPNPNSELATPESNVMKMSDGGGAGNVANSAWPERRVNWSVALKLQQLLNNMGYTIVMTKSSVNEDPTNRRRAEIATEAGAALEIRIHCDGSDTDSSMQGASMLVPAVTNARTAAIHDLSTSYGSTVFNTFLSEMGLHNGGLNSRSDLIGFNWSQTPVILVEMGFLSNPTEALKLTQDDYQNRLAKALADGIAKAVPLK